MLLLVSAIDMSVKYMGERVQFGKPIGVLQGLQWYIAEMATKTEAAKGSRLRGILPGRRWKAFHKGSWDVQAQR